ncbi:MAG: methionine biosynthesis protein MetW [Candidatus Gastranaerophilales bacterium]|nr:methionine biosynthesis protein MetW [Candidatus Gastranaerophilales bacterium]
MNLNYKVVCDLIEKNSKVLDLGCSDGKLLEILKNEKNVKGLGVEIEQDRVLEALQKGLSVVQGDLDKGLGEFQDNTYDYAILNQTLQSTKYPEMIVYEMLRVAKKCIVSFPNFAYWRVRFYLFFKGKMPKSKQLPYEWYDTPNIHLLTICDFFEFCKKRNIKIEKSVYLTREKSRSGFLIKHIANFFSQEVVFVITK